ncbi:autoinducer synthase [Sphingobium phenoxybenzoativorans]|uniref:Acyl-homoserine-lactone synthase n=2 Tax=Sphingomonadaceae TaxID=41297 RepID=A0A975KBK1_9SPHN|nr:autoinducer synthase [Sphingobium phenoxybenzoativorans]
MFEDRKRLFVDTLCWDLPVSDDCYEIDAFDGPAATYLVDHDERGDHLGSLRLLPSSRPHILGSLFPALCRDGVPIGDDTWEITRLCLPTRLGAAGRLAVRNRLISAMVDHALSAGISALTAVVAWDFLEQVRRMGWRCTALGEPTIIGGARLGAFRIDLDADTALRLAATGIYVPDTTPPPSARAAA